MSRDEAPTSELTKIYEEGKKALQESDLKKAIKQFSKSIAAYNSAVDRQDDLAIVHCARSTAYYQIDKQKESLADAEEAIKLKPQWSKVTKVILKTKPVILDRDILERQQFSKINLNLKKHW